MNKELILDGYVNKAPIRAAATSDGLYVIMSIKENFSDKKAKNLYFNVSKEELELMQKTFTENKPVRLLIPKEVGSESKRTLTGLKPAYISLREHSD